jgi:hypothetical protein
MLTPRPPKPLGLGQTLGISLKLHSSCVMLETLHKCLRDISHTTLDELDSWVACIAFSFVLTDALRMWLGHLWMNSCQQ